MKLSNKTDQELKDIIAEVLREQNLRHKLDASPEKITHAIAEYQKATGRGQGEQWEQPVTALDAYRKGAEVEDDGKQWVSTHGNNTGIPGQSGWRLKPELDDDGNEIPPPYVAPSGAHDAYQQGERVTWTDGQVYEAVRDGVAHSPDEYAGDWTLVEPEPEPEEPPEDEEPVDPEPEPEPDPEPEPEPEPEPGTIDNPFTWSGDAVAYQADQYVTYDGILYRVQQAHTSAAHWPPDAVASLYERSG